MPDFAEWLEHPLPGGVKFCGWNFALPRQNLPDSDRRFEGSHRVSAHGVIGDIVQVIGDMKKVGDGGVVKRREFREQ